MKYTIYSLLFALFFFSSCEKAFIESGPDGTKPLEVFDEFSNIYLDKYAMFDFKQVDWIALREAKRKMVTDNTSKEELFEILGDMVLTLRDGHTSLKDLSRDSTKTYDILKGAPENYNIEILVNHLNRIKSTEIIPFMKGTAAYVQIEDNIGYVSISTFNEELPETEIVDMLTNLKDTKGLIIDVRGNTGGDPAAASRLARHLTKTEIKTGFERFKTGPFDFSDSPATNKPAEDGLIYTKPIIILTNGLCYSATTTFIYQTNPIPNVTFIGSRTGGGSGSVANGYLSNGWVYALSVSEFIDNDGLHLDDGFDPDIEVWLDEEVTDTDEVLQRAIDELN